MLLAKKSKHSVGFLFVDIRNAFYRLIRQHLIQQPYAEGFGLLFDSLGLPEGAYEEFRSQLTDATALDQCGLSSHLQAMIQEFLNHPWFTIPGTNQYTVTRKGSRPGDSIADLCFSFVFAKILRKCFDSITALQGVQYHWSGVPEPPGQRQAQIPLEACCPIWADDLAVTIVHTSAQELIGAAANISAFFLIHFVRLEWSLT